jgi:MFS family permease
MGFYAVSMGVALGAAPAIGIWLAGRGWFSALFWLAAGVTAASLVMALLIRVPTPEVGPKMGARARVLAMFVRPAVFPSVLMFLLICGFGAILTLLALLAQDRGIGAAGAWFTLYALVLSFSRAFAGRASDRFGFGETAAVGFVFAVAGLLLVASAQSLWVLLTSAVVFGIGFGTAQPCLQAMLVARTPLARVGSGTALLFFSYDLGTTVGSVGGGALAGVIGFGPVFVVAAAAPVVGLALLLNDVWRSRRSIPTVVG